jgi:hypothetical protein
VKYLIVFLICISLIIGDFEPLFSYLLSIFMFSLEKCLVKSLVNFTYLLYLCNAAEF